MSYRLALDRRARWRFALAATFLAPWVSATAGADPLACPFPGSDVVHAASQLGATFDLAPADKCALVGASVVATADMNDLVCTAKLFDHIGLADGWNAKVKLDGDLYTVTAKPPGASALLTPFQLKAEANATRSTTVMLVTFTSATATDCPADLGVVLKQPQ